MDSSFFKVHTEGVVIHVEWKRFPGGEWHPTVKTPLLYPKSVVVIEAMIVNGEGIIQLLLLNDALRRIFPFKLDFQLLLRYFPYARQDRVARRGEALSVKVVADLINSCGFSLVTVLDAHSPVLLALVNNVSNISSLMYVEILKNHYKDLILVSPDAGAEKKVFDLAKVLKCEMIKGSKHRDVLTGEITKTSVDYGAIKTWHNDYLIVDDICDGGKTFIELSRVLKRTNQHGNIYLYVTHGIFSQGLDVFKGLIDKIYCPNVWPNVPNHPLLERI